MSYLCQTGGGLAQEREEGDSTKLHLKLGLSPLESPLHSRSVSLALSPSLSLAFLGGSAAPARLLRHKTKKASCCIKEIIVRVLAEECSPCPPACPRPHGAHSPPPPPRGKRGGPIKPAPHF